MHKVENRELVEIADNVIADDYKLCTVSCVVF